MVEPDLELDVPSLEGTFVTKALVMSPKDVERALRRVAHEVVEKNKGTQDLIVLGLPSGGVRLAQELTEILKEISQPAPLCGQLAIAPYRDDLHIRPIPVEEVTDVVSGLDGKSVLIVDDVISTGRTVRAALGALNDWGRPSLVQLAVLVDRGHRELPIKPDYVGKNLPTSRDEYVEVSDDGVRILARVSPGKPEHGTGRDR